MMSYEEMKKYMIDELKEERRKMLMNQDNKYSYIFMLCNDMGIIDPKEFNVPGKKDIPDIQYNYM